MIDFLTQALVLSLILYILSRLFNKKKEPNRYERPNNICEICNGTGNEISPRCIDRNSNNKYKCRICNGTGRI